MGSGKTALAHSICQYAQENDCLISGFFFSRLRPEESTPRHLFGALIRGLCRVGKDVRNAITRILQDDDTLPVASPTRQFEQVILPICPLLPKATPLVVVVDALDEGYDKDLLKILRDGVPLLPPNLCIVVSTRPEGLIMSWLEDAPHVQRLSQSLVHTQDTHQDIIRYIHDRFGNPPFQTFNFPPKLIKEFGHRCEGVFLWAEVIITYLEGLLNPEKALKSILDATSEPHRRRDWGVEKKLDDLYDQILTRLTWSDESVRSAYRVFMGAVVTLKEPVSLNALIALYASRPTDVEPEDLVQIAKLLRPLLDNFYPTALDRPIRLLHLSARDFLTLRVAPSKPYHLDIEECNRVMAQLTLSTIERDLKPDLPMLGYTAGDDNWDFLHIPRVPKLPPATISDHLAYSCRFFVDHVVCSGNEDLIPVSWLCDILLHHSRPLVELTAVMGKVVNIGEVRMWIEVRSHSVLCDPLC